jgi:hypothetical protein
LRQKGRIHTGNTGNFLEWRVKKTNRDLNVLTEGGPITISRSQLHDTAQEGWYAYEVNDAVSEMERKMNGAGPTQIINLVGGMLDDMKADFELGFNKELYKNGSTTTNAGRIMGVESIFRINTATIPTGGAGGEILAAAAHSTLDYATIDLVATSNANYYWRPVMVVDSNSGAFGAGGFTATTALKIFDHAVVKQSEKNKGKFADLGITTFAWYKFLREALMGKESIYIGRPGTSASEYSDDLGFHFVKMNGVPVYPESDWPTQKQGGDNGMYLLQTSKMSYEVLGDKFLNYHQDLDIDAGLISEFLISHYGNLKFDSPRHQCKIVEK